jgi:hypothetical protein
LPAACLFAWVAVALADDAVAVAVATSMRAKAAPVMARA